MKPVEVRQTAILDAAQGLMLKHGLRGTSMEAIARAAKIAKPTLYVYFPDKPAIITALIERLAISWREAFLTGIRGEGDVVQRIAAAMSLKHKAVMQLLANSPHADELYGEHDRGAAPQFAALEAELAALIERELSMAGASRARIATQFFLAASYGIGRKAKLPAEIGPAFRLLSERLLRPELP
ncbi:MAG: TetR/AcrR family transcriptional regulator [Devosia sp.]